MEAAAPLCARYAPAEAPTRRWRGPCAPLIAPPTADYLAMARTYDPQSFVQFSAAERASLVGTMERIQRPRRAATGCRAGSAVSEGADHGGVPPLAVSAVRRRGPRSLFPYDTVADAWPMPQGPFARRAPAAAEEKAAAGEGGDFSRTRRGPMQAATRQR